jgi:hypothetical protein
MTSDLPSRSIAKEDNFLDIYFEEKEPDLYLQTIDNINVDHQYFFHWIYRNGKFSDQIKDFDLSSKKIIKELANLSFSNNPTLDMMYFSGVIKMIYAKNKCIYLECCVRPSLDQMIMLKDFERLVLPESGVVLWKVVERRNRNSSHTGVGLDKLHNLNWSRIK